MLLKTADKILSPLVFQILILVATAFMLVPFIHYAYGGYVKYILLIGIIICTYQFFRKGFQDLLKDKASIALLCFAFFYFVTILLNRHTMLAENIKQLAYMLVFFLLLTFPKGKKTETMPQIIYFLVAVTMILSANSFVTYFFNINEWYVLDAEYYVGMHGGYRFCGFYNPNTCGAIAAVSLIASLYILLVKRNKNKATCIVLALITIVNIVLQYVVLLLSESRGSYYSFLFVIAVFTFVGVFKNYKPEKTSAALRVMMAICISVILALLLLKSSTFIQHSKDKLCIVSSEDSENTSKDTSYENYLEEILKKYSSDTSALTGVIRANTMSIKDSLASAVSRSDISDTTGRLPIWKTAVAVFREKPVFGWTREGSIEPLNIVYEQFNGRSTTSIDGGGIHNVYLTILCSSGLAGFVCFLIAILTIAIRFLSLLSDKGRISSEVLISFAMVLYFLISELVESRILYTVSFFNVVFWLYLGYFNYYCLKGKTNGAEEI